MAELAALGLASNIVQFIDFGITLFHEGKEIYESSEGSSAKRLELETITADLRDIVHELQPTIHPVTKDDAALGRLAKDCEKLATDLLCLLDKLKVKESQHPKWASFKQALNSVLKEGAIRNLESRLEKCRDQLGKRLLYMLSNQQSAVLSTIQDLEDENRRLGANTAQKLDDIKQQLLGQAEAGDYAQVEINLRALAEEGSHAKKGQNILRSLQFPSIRIRHEAIKLAHAKSFRWIFQSPHSNFCDWLRTGEGIYWVQGKAGSGKSTLFRFLSGHDETRSNLKVWAGTNQLFIASHFFWNAGNSMQKSQRGLLQTLLYQVFRQYPNLLQLACRDRWSNETSRSEPWTYDELFETFHKLSKINLSSARFCFLVDGLDEYSGNHQDLITLIDSLATSTSIKFCVSSRPWNVFENAFGNSSQQLRLEDLTREDIRTYVQSHLAENAKFKRLQSRSTDSSSIVNEIVIRARGVFLWVSLVVGSLLRGLIDGDDVSDMKRRLDTFPSDLEEYFEHMIQNIEPFYRDDAVRFFEIAVNGLQPLPLLAFKFLEEEQQRKDYALDSSVQPFELPQIKNICENMKRRLNARCKDLLEVIEDTSESSHIMFRYKADFLHRTVRDFFLETNAVGKLRQGRPDFEFDVKLSLCKIMVALDKALPFEKDLGPVLNHMFSLSDEFMFHARDIGQHSDEAGAEVRQLNVVKLLDELDRVNIDHTKSLKFHWSNLRDVPKGPFMELYQKTLLAAAVQSKVTLYVRQKIDTKQVRGKRGRPLLDYALRPNMITPIELPDYEPRPDFDLVSILLDHGADPNQAVFIYDDKTVWSLFLEMCYENGKKHSLPPSDKEFKDLYLVIELLVKKGADPSLTFESNGKLIEIVDALKSCLTRKDINTLENLLAQKRKNSFGFWKFFGLG